MKLDKVYLQTYSYLQIAKLYKYIVQYLHYLKRRRFEGCGPDDAWKKLCWSAPRVSIRLLGSRTNILSIKSIPKSSTPSLFSRTLTWIIADLK
jgi:hypothetical protein